MIHLTMPNTDYAYDGSVISRQENAKVIAAGTPVSSVTWPYFGKDFDFVPDILDDYLVDLPTYTDYDKIAQVADQAHMYGYRMVGYVYDLDTLRYPSAKLPDEFGLFDYLIVPSEAQAVEINTYYDATCIVVGPSAYPKAKEFKPGNGKLVYAGNLNKASFLYDIKTDIDVYGLAPDYTFSPYVHYKGKARSEELPDIIAQYSAGLVWDSGSMEEPSYRSYMQSNWPCKFDMYLAAGIPTITPIHTNAGSFAESNGCGVNIESLVFLKAAMDELKNPSYRKNARSTGTKVQAGVYPQIAVKKVLELLKETN